MNHIVFVFKLYNDTDICYVNTCLAHELATVSRTIFQMFNEASLVFVSNLLSDEQSCGMMIEMKEMLSRFHEYKHVYTVDANKLIAWIEEYSV